MDVVGVEICVDAVLVECVITRYENRWRVGGIG